MVESHISHPSRSHTTVNFNLLLLIDLFAILATVTKSQATVRQSAGQDLNV